MKTHSIILAALLCACLVLMTMTSCGGGTTITTEEDFTPATTPETVYAQVVGFLNPTTGERSVDGPEVLDLTATTSQGDRLVTGILLEIPVKDGSGQVKITSNTSAWFLVDGEWKKQPLDTWRVLGNPLLDYLLTVGEYKVVSWDYDNQGKASATIAWNSSVPLGADIGSVLSVSASPQGMGEVGRQMNGWDFQSAMTEITTTIVEESNNSDWWIAPIAGVVGWIAGSAVAAVPVCPRTEIPFTTRFVDMGGNGGNITPPPPPTNHNPVLDPTGPTKLMVDVDGTWKANATDPDGDSLSYKWFVDGTLVGTNPTLNYSFSEPGTYLVRVEVRDGRGGFAFFEWRVVVTAQAVNNPPNAALTANPSTGINSVVVTLDASGSTDSDGTIVKYEWDFDGNGSYESTTTAATTTHTYTIGNHKPKVRVTDDDAASDTATVATAIVVEEEVVQQKLYLDGVEIDPDTIQVILLPAESQPLDIGQDVELFTAVLGVGGEEVDQNPGLWKVSEWHVPGTHGVMAEVNSWSANFTPTSSGSFSAYCTVVVYTTLDAAGTQPHWLYRDSSESQVYIN